MKLLRLKKNQEGAAAIEFVIVAPVFFLLLFGIIEFGLLMFTQSILEGAVASAARHFKAQAGITPSGGISQMRTLISTYGSGYLQPSLMRVAVSRVAGGWGNNQLSDGAPSIGGLNDFLGTSFDGTSLSHEDGSAANEGEIMQYHVYYDHYFATPLIGNIICPDRNVFVVKASVVVQNEPNVF